MAEFFFFLFLWVWGLRTRNIRQLSNPAGTEAREVGVEDPNGHRTVPDWNFHLSHRQGLL